MKKQDTENRIYLRNRKWFAVVSLLAFATMIVLLTLFFIKVLAPYMSSTEQLRAFLDSYGWKGRFILLGLQIAQVFIALIPGEVIEVGAGYAYGIVEGTLICLAGVAIASSFVFLLVKKIGVSLVELFISRQKIQELRFINSEKKLKRLVFLLFLIPGTPKDVLTYFVGLTAMRLPQFLAISLIARIPSVVTSTISGQMLGDKEYLIAGLVYAVTGGISLLGYHIYNRIVKRRQSKKENVSE
ncbi:MAG: TVP38/TMEM64 family protein [Clostridia bacterium]|nr:TVP38/TMEM64 family protein [Clostridia bacterium]